MSLTEPTLVRCPHCMGSGEILIPPEVATVEAYYFGCRREAGHYWHFPEHRTWNESTIPTAVGPKIHPKIDGGFCPGSIDGESYKRSRPEKQGEAALHHVDGWTVLSFWDNSVDARSNSSSSFVARGTWDYASMRAIAERQFARIWKRYTFDIVLIE